MFFTVVFKTTSYFSTFDVFRKCRCSIYCHLALQLMLLCFSCKQGWVPVPGIKLWKLIDLINNSHKRHDAHMRIPIHMHETQFTCTKKLYFRQKDARLENGVEATRWSREAKLSCSELQVLTLFIYICK